MGGRSTGIVTEFDRQRGLGQIKSNEGAELSFHATSIADGTRNISVGQRVTFARQAAHRGVFEAVSLLSVSNAQSGVTSDAASVAAPLFESGDGTALS